MAWFSTTDVDDDDADKWGSGTFCDAKGLELKSKGTALWLVSKFDWLSENLNAFLKY